MLDFLQLIFPISNLNSTSKIVTAIFVFVTIAYFIVALFLFGRKVYKRCKLLKRLTENIRNIDKPVQPKDLHKIENWFNKAYEKSSLRNKEFSEAWKDFQNTLVTRDIKDNQKIVYKTEGVEHYLNEDRLIGQYLNLRYWSSIPSQLVGLGILGTFFGLTYGLSGIKFTDVKTINDSIRQLLAGSSVAFVTSIWGMFTSLLFNLAEKHSIGSLGMNIANLQREINQLFSLTAQEEIQYRQLDELEQQTSTLKAFSTDLANNIKVAMDTIISDRLDNLAKQTTQIYEHSSQSTQKIVEEVQKLGENIGNHVKEGVSNTIQNQLLPALENLNNAVSEIRKLKEESSLNAIQQMVDKFQASFSNTTITQLEELSKTVNSASSGLASLPKQISEIMAEVQEQVKETQKILTQSSISAQEDADRRIREMEQEFTTLIQTLQNSINEQQIALVRTVGNISEEAASVTDIMREQVQNAAQSYSKSIKELQQGVNILLNQQHSQTQAVNNLCENTISILEKGYQLVKQMDESLTSIKDVFKNTQTLSNQLLNGSQKLNDAGLILTKTSAQFAEQNERYLTANRETLKQVQESLNHSQQILSDYAQKFQIIQTGLNSIFGDIQKGLNSYSISVRDSINDYLAQFSGQLSEAVSALSGSVAGLNDTVGDLTDIHEELAQLHKVVNAQARRSI